VADRVWLTIWLGRPVQSAYAAQRADEREQAAEDAAAKKRKLAEDEAARLAAMPSLRERSRQEYLAKREQQKIEQLRLIIKQEERLFRDEKLTERERLELERKKELLRLAEERMSLTANVDHYQMPEGALAGRDRWPGELTNADATVRRRAWGRARSRRAG